MENEPREIKYETPARCHICGKDILVDERGSGGCTHCGWWQSRFEHEFRDRVFYPNMISFNNAKKQVEARGWIKPTFEDFIEGYKLHREVEFLYHGSMYGVLSNSDNGGLDFYKEYSMEGYQEYKTIDEFREKANINGKRLADIWDEVEEPFYM